ncbi:hypothetical protein BBK36DRAFT_1157953 [Trichoderma citrinoviride]|uniref:Uncharacterized protein n=1 Tax=Trichoderma citrinoviride TaxID=58853 RepID=A0A2T4BG48_9HYPO|nr:hypothetical protein BBK36DRAFT_1157953 [Trichoderma citrinoviride]PTB68282.1 hypothetical protein BBK36DRAFT_1157953 [Trichoderma citrinoviride]
MCDIHWIHRASNACDTPVAFPTGATTTTPCRANKHPFETGNASEAKIQPRWLDLRWQSRLIAILILILILTRRHGGIHTGLPR